MGVGVGGAEEGRPLLNPPTGAYIFLRGGPARESAPEPRRTLLLWGDLRLQLSCSSISFLFSALGWTRGGILRASWIGVDILSRVSRMSRAVVDIVSVVGRGEGEEEVEEGREEGATAVELWEARAARSVWRLLSPAL